jgi:CelD/BcsL family acetyltransferase involved in cellulose biosynthesis
MRLRDDWASLFAASPTASAPLRFDWLWEWWRVYRPSFERAGARLAVIVVERGSELIGALPLFQSNTSRHFLVNRRLGFLSTGEAEFEETAPDYLDLLHRPGDERLCLDAISRLIFDERIVRWDILDLPNVSSRSPLTQWPVPSSSKCHTSTVDGGVCPVADLHGGFDSYLQRLSPKTRQHARQYLRAAARLGVTFEIAASEEDVDLFFADLVNLHQDRWKRAGKPGCFASARFLQFHRAIASTWVPQGKAIIARLSSQGKPITALYGFLTGSKFDFYQSGVEAQKDAQPLSSPGTTALLLLMQHLAQRGITEFDFLRGSSSYKRILATDQSALQRIQIRRPSVRSSIVAASDLVVRASRKGPRILRCCLEHKMFRSRTVQS